MLEQVLIRCEARRLYTWIILLLLGAVALSAAWVYHEFAQDDAYITYRYARNLVKGYGFVYNQGDSILGTTTPLYALFLAFLGKLSGQDIHVLGHLLGAGSLWVSGAVVYYLGRDRDVSLATATALVFTSNAFLMTSFGMETLFLLALLLLSLKSYVNESFVLAGVLLGLTALTRYETVLFACLLGAHFWISRRRMPTWLGTMAVISVPWLIYAWCTVGQIIPHSAMTKLALQATGHGPRFAVGAFLWWRAYSLDGSGYYLLLPLVLLGGYAASRSNRDHGAYLLLLAWTAVYFLAASFTAGSFSWYYGPLIPGFSILSVWGAELLAGMLSAVLEVGSLHQRIIRNLQTIAFALIILGVVALQVSSWNIYWVVHDGRVVDARYPRYIEVAHWLNRNASPQASLAAEEIGILGYYTDLTIIDLYGLVTPDLEPWLEQSRTETLRNALDRYHPDYILANRSDWIHLLQEIDEYELAHMFESDHLALFSRVAEEADLAGKDAQLWSYSHQGCKGDSQLANDKPDVASSARQTSGFGRYAEKTGSANLRRAVPVLDPT